jgi:penicillin amidase
MIWLLALPAAAAAVLVYLYRRPLPRLDGRIVARGLGAPVEVVRDRWGVPHLYAQTSADLFFAQGYVHAQDRLWQMELNRRVGWGRLSEAFGAVAYETDRLLRVLGFGRAARAAWDATDADTRATLEAYARGVNAFIDDNRGRWGLEFTLLGLTPERWTPADSIVWTKMMAWGLSTNWDTELLNAAFIGRVGVEKAAQLHGDYPTGNPIVVPGSTLFPVVERVLGDLHAAKAWLPITAPVGMSNNWVVDGTKSVTGRPLLSNDPHLSLQMPSIWYENHLSSREEHVTGVSLPGVPGVIIGHNEHLAWGLTAGLPDTQDLYIEKFDSKNPLKYEFRGQLEDATVVREEIRVKGQAARTIEVVITRHGPIIDALPLTGGAKLALRWTGHDVGQAARGILSMSRACTVDEFVAALADWDGPSMNVVYAHTDGTIGYHFTGKIPIRQKGFGVTPVPGWTGEHEWIGFIPHAELPQSRNPETHYLASANNLVTGKEYPHFLGAQQSNGFRARRITELLTAKEKLSAEDYARMHVDQYCAPAKPFCELMVALTDEILAAPELAEVRAIASAALAELKRWDHVLGADSVPGAIYHLTQHFAMRRVFEPWLGDLTEAFCGVGHHPVIAPVAVGFLDRSFLFLQKILVENDADWLKQQSRAKVLAAALADAIRWLRQAVGPELRDWKWGAVHPARFNHPLGAKKPLDRLFNRGPYPYGGDINTVWQASFVPKLPYEPAGGFTASWRQIMDLSDWDASRAVHTTGQSGHPASPHYDDMIPMWLKGEYHPLLWKRERVEAHAAHRLTLVP